MKTEIHPAPTTGWFETFKSADGKIVGTAFCDTNIGVGTTTDTHVMRLPDGSYEARVGFAIMGPPQMPEEDFKKCGYNPFHPDFHDNAASGKGATVQAAIEALGKELKSIGDSLWADDF